MFGDWNGASKQGVNDIERFENLLQSKVNQELKEVDLYEGVKELLAELNKQGKKIVLVASSTRRYIEPAMKKHGIYEIFDLILDGNDVKNHKPDPEVILKAIELLKTDKDNTILMGDSKSDLGAAQAAQIDSILFYPESHKIYYDKDFLLRFNPNYVIKSIIEAQKLLL